MVVRPTNAVSKDDDLKTPGPNESTFGPEIVLPVAPVGTAHITTNRPAK
jgi:hypothetical protein